MALTNAQYDTIIRTYEERQLALRQRLEDRLAYVCSHVPGYDRLQQQLASLSLSHARLLLEGDEHALKKLNAALSEVRAGQGRLLEKAGLGADYLEPEYHCPLCRDTGYADRQKCRCFKQKMIRLLYEQSNIAAQLDQENFSTLSEEFYQGEDLANFRLAANACRGFVRDFPGSGRNLFFYGSVGTGKSFLSGCVARELLEAGRSVIYFSAVSLIERIARRAFDYQSREGLSDLYDDLYTCDLLIIDDLGTEVTNAFSSSQLFSCLNERLLRKTSTIISTNLSLQELRDRYSDRIFSRITSNFDLYKLTGPDIRMQKKRLSNRK